MPGESEFHQAISRRSDHWYGACLRITRSPELARDAMQDGLLSAWRKRRQFEGGAQLETWIHRICVNSALSLVRARHPERWAPLDMDVSDEEFDPAVRQLGIMGATAELAQLSERPGASESLIQAYAIAGDTQSLLILARDNSDPERQMAALQGLGIAGGDGSTEAFLEIYRGTDNYEVKEAVMHGLMIAGDDSAVLELFKAAEDDQEKADLLRTLVIMDSDAAIDAIDAALGGNGS